MSKPKLPLTITLPIPYAIPRARGIHSTEAFGSSSTVRYTLDETDVITQACNMLGLKRAEFFRCVGVEAAKAIVKHKL